MITFTYSLSQEVLEYPLEYASILHKQKLYQIHLASSTKRDWLVLLQFDLINFFLLFQIKSVSHLFFLHTQGCTSTEIVGAGPRPQKNVGHHGWPTEKILSFKWTKTTRSFETFGLFWNFLKYVQNFYCSSKQFLSILFFLQEYFFIKIQKFKKGSVQNETMYILYKLLYQIIFRKY